MLYLHIKPEVIAQRVAKLKPVGTRLNVMEGINNCLVIVDSYTSDFNSLAPAIDFMARRAKPDMSMTVVLSDVLHEAYSRDELYGYVAELLEQKHVNRVIGIGPEMCQNSRFFDVNSRFFPSTADFLENVSQSDFEDEIILIKGAPEFGQRTRFRARLSLHLRDYGRQRPYYQGSGDVDRVLPRLPLPRHL